MVLSKHSASTLVIRLPLIDWPALRAGTKSEVRVTSRSTSFLAKIEPPQPFLGVARSRHSEDRTGMFVLEGTWLEMLGAISQESIEREGFASIKEFRRYWRDHRSSNRAFKPLERYRVVRLRPWTPEDYDVMARRLLDRLYGPWL
jgi:hypothetical protein